MPRANGTHKNDASRTSLSDEQASILSLEESLKDLRRTGIHNLRLLHRELLQTRRKLRKIAPLLTPD